MDYPLTEPGVALLDGKFTDGNPLLGLPASRDPASWANAVTDELLGVLEEGDIVPAEGNNGQVRLSIKAIALKVIRLATSKATEVLWGVLRVGTQAEVDAGALDDVAVTPKKMRWGFLVSLTQNGYIVFPTWMLGFIIQWGRQTNATTAGAVTSFPLAYPNECFGVFIQDHAVDLTSTSYHAVGNAPSTTSFTVYTASTANGPNYFHISIGW